MILNSSFKLTFFLFSKDSERSIFQDLQMENEQNQI